MSDDKKDIVQGAPINITWATSGVRAEMRCEVLKDGAWRPVDAGAFLVDPALAKELTHTEAYPYHVQYERSGEQRIKLLITPTHRRLAVEANGGLFGDEIERYLLRPMNGCTFDRIAIAIAAAEQRGNDAGRAAEKEDCAAWLRFELGYDQTADDFDAGAHVGAAKKHADEVAAQNEAEG